MKKQTLKLLSFIALSSLATQANGQWIASGSNITATSTASNIITFQPSTTGAVRGLAGNTNNYLEVFANTNGDNGASLYLNSNTSTGGSPAGSITMMSSSNVATDDAFHILNHPNSTTWNSLFKIKNNGIVEISGTTKTWDVQALGNGYIDGNLQVGTSTVPGEINCTGTTKTWDVQAFGNGYIDGLLRIGNGVSLPSGYKLYVQDGILTEKVKVALSSDPTNWSDFVFDENYDLKPLSEVEKFIKKNKHLPEIPSTEEIHKEGLDLAQMDAKLLQKVEELTLYVIQQQKEIQQLKSKIK